MNLGFDKPQISNDPSARRIVAGELEAIFLPGHGMLCASLRHRNEQILRRIEDLDAAAARGSTAGIPLLYPWANRLAGPHYAVRGREVDLDLSSPLLHLDEHGLPMHGVPWALLAWTVTEAREDALSARLEWTNSDLLAIFPFSHRVEITASLGADGLLVETTVVASPDGPVPVSFGFHPYFGLPELPRADWRLELPAMRRLVLDGHGIPSGEEQTFDGFNGPLGEISFDDCFALPVGSSLAMSGAGRRITVEFLSGYEYAQVFAPKGKDFIALEPMTAPTNALASGLGLRLVGPGGEFRSAFQVRVEAVE